MWENVQCPLTVSDLKSLSVSNKTQVIFSWELRVKIVITLVLNVFIFD